MTTSRHSDVATMSSGQFFGRNKRTMKVGGFHFVENVYHKGTFTPRHAHTLPHFCWVLSGRYDELIERRNFDRSASTLMYLPAGASHAETHHSTVRSFLFEFEPERFCDSTRDLTVPQEIASLGIHQLVHRLYREFSRPDPWSQLVVEALAMEIYAESSRELTLGRATRPPNWLQAVKDQLHDEMLKSPSRRNWPRRAARMHRMSRGSFAGILV